MGDIFFELFQEVHRSNMSKACKTLEEVEETQMWYATHKGTPNTDYIEVGDVFFVIDKDNNNKTLKSINYSPANLLPILNKGMGNNGGTGE